jgi:hypothetical protein
LLPVTWQIELIENVTWWRRATRTRLPQKKAVSAPCQDHDHSPPTSGGSSIDRTTQSGKARETRRMAESLQRSGANFSSEVCSTSKSQPRWA